MSLESPARFSRKTTELVIEVEFARIEDLGGRFMTVTCILCMIIGSIVQHAYQVAPPILSDGAGHIVSGLLCDNRSQWRVDLHAIYS